MDEFHLREGCQELVDLTGDWTASATTVEWQNHYGDKGREELFKLSVLAIVSKQYESLRSILTMEDRRESFSAVPLLRAMCEELIWVRYLATLSPPDQGRVVAHLASVGLSEALIAQDSYGGRNLDFGVAWRAKVFVSASAAKTELRGMFTSQGFQLNKSATTPSVAQLAKRADLESMYKFVYHGTSRAVHFSVPELLRRVWGRPGTMKVTSNTFERYWSAFLFTGEVGFTV